MASLVICSREKAAPGMRGEEFLSSARELDGRGEDIFRSVSVECDASAWTLEDWTLVHKVLRKENRLFVRKSTNPEAIRLAVRLRTLFFPVKETKEVLIFAPLTTLDPSFVAPDEIATLMQKAQPLNSLFGSEDSPACGIVKPFAKSQFRIGGGNEGDIYFAPEWWTEVVVKRVREVADSGGNVFRNPVENAYTGGRSTEVLGASLLNKLLEGTSEHGKLYNIQRYTGFFVCDGSMDRDLYLINEKMDGDLRQFCGDMKRTLKELKVCIWQAIFTLVCLNSLNFYHHDCSIQNFFYRKVHPEETFLGAKVGASDTWTFRLGDRAWRLPNVGLVVKTADFGFLTHLEKPLLFIDQIPDFRMDNTNQGFADVNYFLTTLLFFAGRNFTSRVSTDFDPLFAEWFDLLHLDTAKILAAADRVAALRQHGDILDSFRSNPKHDKWDPIALLEGKFFSDVVEKL